MNVSKKPAFQWVGKEGLRQFQASLKHDSKENIVDKKDENNKICTNIKS